MTERRHSKRRSEQPSFEEELFSETGVTEIAIDQELQFPVVRIQMVRENHSVCQALHSIRKPEDAAKIFERYLGSVDREHFVVILLDTKHRVIGINTVSIGILDCALAHPREVFKPAILSNAKAFILCHNHPSGDPEPSLEDRAVTTRIAQAAAILGIELHDHVILGAEGRFRSLKQLGVF